MIFPTWTDEQTGAEERHVACQGHRAHHTSTEPASLLKPTPAPLTHLLSSRCPPIPPALAFAPGKRPLSALYGSQDSRRLGSDLCCLWLGMQGHLAYPVHLSIHCVLCARLRGQHHGLRRMLSHQGMQSSILHWRNRGPLYASVSHFSL